MVSVAILVPNAFQVFGNRYKNSKSRNNLNRSLRRLASDRLVTIKQQGDHTVISLTKNGKKKYLKYKLEDLKLKKPKKWDKKWRLVIFDVPNQYNAARMAFTRKLKELGFVYLQKSIWVTPYPCKDEVDFIKEIYEIRPFVRLITADFIDIQHDLIKKFGF